MIAVNGYIDGNTLVAIDDSLRNFNGSEILIRLVDKPKNKISAGSERQKALQAIQGVLKTCRPTSIAEIREERLKERYGL